MKTGNFLIDSGMQEQNYTPTGLQEPKFVQGIKNLANPTKEKKYEEPEYIKAGLKSQEEYDIAVGMKNDGFTHEEFLEALEDFRRQKFLLENPEVENNINQIEEEEKNEKGFFSKAWDFGKKAFNVFGEEMNNTVGGGVTAIPKMAGNTAGFLTDLVDKIPVNIAEDGSKWDLGTLADQFRKGGAEETKKFREISGVDEDSYFTKGGELVAEMFLGTKGVDKLSKLGQLNKLGNLINKIPGGAKAISQAKTLGANFGKTHPSVAKALGAFFTEAGVGASEMAKFGIVSDGTLDGVGKSAVIGSVAGPVINGVGKLTKGIGEHIYVASYRPSKQEAEAIFAEAVGKIKNRFPTKAETAFSNKIWGTQKGIGISAVKKANNLWKKEIQPKLEASKETIKKSDMFDYIKKKIGEEIEPGRKADLTKAYDKLMKEFSNDPIEYSMVHAQRLKSGLDKFTPKKAFKGEDIAQAYKELKSEMANYIRSNIHSKISSEFGVNSASNYIKYANLKGLQALGVKGIQTGGEGVLLTPGGTGTLIANLWGKIMTPVQTAGGLTLYKVGDSFTIIAKNGLKVFSDYIKDINNN